MAAYYYNSKSPLSREEQWKNHLQTEAYFDDVTKSIENQTAEYNRLTLKQINENRNNAQMMTDAIHIESSKQAETQRRQAARVVGAIDNMSSQISMNIRSLECMLSYKTAALIDQQKISNLLTKNIAQLLKIPDFQKERQYYIEQGFKHYQNARLDQDLFHDALENLLEAEKRNKSDYIVLHRIGMIYLYAPELMKIEKAEYYFRRAVKYAVVESDPDAMRIANIMIGDISQDLQHQKDNPDAIKLLAADSCYQAGVSCYIQGKLELAMKYFTKALKLNPISLSANLNLAKLLITQSKMSKAVQIIHPQIKRFPIYSTAIANDPTLANSKEIQNLLEKFRDSAIHKLKKSVDLLKKKYHRLAARKGGDIENDFNDLNNAIKQNQFLLAINALKRIPIIINNLKEFRTGLSLLSEMKKNGFTKNDFGYLAKKIEYIEKNISLNRYINISKNSKKCGKLATFKKNLKNLQTVSFNQDGSLLASFSYYRGEYTIKLWDVVRQECISTFKGKLKDAYQTTLCFSHHNRLLLSNHGMIWDVAKQKCIATLPCEAITPDFCLLASFYQDTNFLIKLWDIAKLECVSTIKVSKNPKSRHNYLTFSPNARLLAINIPDANTVELWDIENQKCISTLRGHYNSIIFSPDSTLLACISSDLILWDVAKNECIATLEYSPLTGFSPDGSLLVKYEKFISNQVSLWDVATQEYIAILKGHVPNDMMSITFSPDGSLLVGYSNDTIILWDSILNIKTGIKNGIVAKKIARKNAQKRSEIIEKLRHLRKKEIEVQEEKRKKQEEKRKKAEEFYRLGTEELAKQDKKWFFRNYQHAYELFSKALELGHEKAKVSLQQLGFRMGR